MAWTETRAEWKWTERVYLTPTHPHNAHYSCYDITYIPHNHCLPRKAFFPFQNCTTANFNFAHHNNEPTKENWEKFEGLERKLDSIQTSLNNAVSIQSAEKWASLNPWICLIFHVACKKRNLLVWNWTNLMDFQFKSELCVITRNFDIPSWRLIYWDAFVFIIQLWVYHTIYR